MVKNIDEHWMSEALAVVISSGSDPASTPIGFVIVRDQKIIDFAHSECQIIHDVIAHAEMVAFRPAGLAVPDDDNEGGELRGATLYSTLQPCGMCTMASIRSKVGRIVFGAGCNDAHRMYFETRHIDTLDFIAKAYRDDLMFTDGVLREDCVRLYYPPEPMIRGICRRMSLAVCSNVVASFVAGGGSGPGKNLHNSMSFGDVLLSGGPLANAVLLR